MQTPTPLDRDCFAALAMTADTIAPVNPDAEFQACPTVNRRCVKRSGAP